MKRETLKYLHIGMPKNLSSALQKHYFPNHQDIYHLGVGTGSLIDYIDTDVNAIFENFLLYSNEFDYNQNFSRILKSIESHYENACRQDYKAFGASLELLSFTFTPDMVDVPTKSRRLRQLFGENTKIIIIIRNQEDLIKSMYREFIKIGFDQSYERYLEYIYNYQSRSFFYDFSYQNLYDTFSSSFGPNNIEIIPIEQHRDSDGELSTHNGCSTLIKRINNILGVHDSNIVLGHENLPLTESELYHKRELNKTHPHDLSNQLFSGADNHRLTKYFLNYRNLQLSDPFKDIKTKRYTIEKARQLAKSFSQSIDYSCPSRLSHKLKEFYETENKKLSTKTGLELPGKYFNLSF